MVQGDVGVAKVEGLIPKAMTVLHCSRKLMVMHSQKRATKVRKLTSMAMLVERLLVMLLMVKH